jgi:hypothetical protein
VEPVSTCFSSASVCSTAQKLNHLESKSFLISATNMSQKRSKGTANAFASFTEDGKIVVPPKKPQPAFFFFQLECRKKLANEYKTKHKQVATARQEAAYSLEVWHSLTDEERAPFNLKARLDAERYET